MAEAASATARRQPMPRLIRVRLRQIATNFGDERYAWQTNLRYVTKMVPSLNEAAIPLIELLQPMLLCEADTGVGDAFGEKRYQLLAGVRTYQLVLQHRPRDWKSLCLLLPNQPTDDEVERYRAFDALVTKITQRPDGSDLALMGAALLEDLTLRERVGRYIDVSTDGSIANALGMSRATLHRLATPLRKAATEAPPDASRPKVALEIDPMELDEKA